MVQGFLHGRRDAGVFPGPSLSALRSLALGHRRVQEIPIWAAESRALPMPLEPPSLDKILVMPAGSDMDKLILEHVCLGNWDGESSDFSTNDATALDLLKRLYYFINVRRETLSEGQAGKYAGLWMAQMDYDGGLLYASGRAETFALAVSGMLLMATEKYGYLFDEEWPRES